MKRLFAILFLFCFMTIHAKSQNSSTRQGEQPLNMLVAETLDALIDTMSTFHFRINDVNNGRLYDTSVYLLFGDDVHSLLKLEEYSKHKPSVIKCGNNGVMTIYSYGGDSSIKWNQIKKIKSKKRFNIAEWPRVIFYHDTVKIFIRSSYLSWGNETHKKVWSIGVSDWISCKFVYSEADKRWVMIESEFGGI